ncbi:unnamed protein product (macronuclear) [Paramecium tetraurelia]|uniref:Insertion element IS150 protein InsJ-like helix-turn-helix domain-containing protein n=1 Tax=Paramecium tetraurelia TaxID=5888 RepID=A0DJT3_PARTE|nr:uncharacterized protein GSPATT00017644001 [Paramecium tetraurelia]CAK83300.1 unnamed protein product [Paramecium tetraurelia]|eukprot:XP_001450697.1 hypothetical protein (macronuclear) [Paramecium tetraurelia strain d4-2]
MIPSDNEEQFSPHKLKSIHFDQKPKDLSKKYAVIDQSKRVLLLKRILSREATIKEAAKEFGVNFSTAKAILSTYRKEGRIGKKKTREKQKKEKEQKQYSLSNERKVQSMYDLERDVSQKQRSFSPDLKSIDQHITNSLLHQHQLLISKTTQNIISTQILEEKKVSIALANCKRELEKQKFLNLQLVMMISSLQQKILQYQMPLIKEELS